jgi:hypothetical protein
MGAAMTRSPENDQEKSGISASARFATTEVDLKEPSFSEEISRSIHKTTQANRELSAQIARALAAITEKRLSTGELFRGFDPGAYKSGKLQKGMILKIARGTLQGPLDEQAENELKEEIETFSGAMDLIIASTENAGIREAAIKAVFSAFVIGLRCDEDGVIKSRLDSQGASRARGGKAKRADPERRALDRAVSVVFGDRYVEQPGSSRYVDPVKTNLEPKWRRSTTKDKVRRAIERHNKALLGNTGNAAD